MTMYMFLMSFFCHEEKNFIVHQKADVHIQLNKVGIICANK
jgi:hypothetical protein